MTVEVFEAALEVVPEMASEVAVVESKGEGGKGAWKDFRKKKHGVAYYH